MKNEVLLSSSVSHDHKGAELYRLPFTSLGSTFKDFVLSSEEFRL